MLLGSKRSTFEAVVRAHAATLYRVALWLCRDRHQANDLVQETLSRAWRSWATLRDVERARVWLLAICRNEHARTRRREQTRGDEELDLEASFPGVEAARGDAIAHEVDLRRAIEGMPLAYREPLLLQVLGGFTCAEIAELLGTTEGAIMTRLTRARQALRGLLVEVAPPREVRRQ